MIEITEDIILGKGAHLKPGSNQPGQLLGGSKLDQVSQHQQLVGVHLTTFPGVHGTGSQLKTHICGDREMGWGQPCLPQTSRGIKSTKQYPVQ